MSKVENLPPHIPLNTHSDEFGNLAYQLNLETFYLDKNNPPEITVEQWEKIESLVAQGFFILLEERENMKTAGDLRLGLTAENLQLNFDTKVATYGQIACLRYIAQDLRQIMSALKFSPNYFIERWGRVTPEQKPAEAANLLAVLNDTLPLTDQITTYLTLINAAQTQILALYATSYNANPSLHTEANGFVRMTTLFPADYERLFDLHSQATKASPEGETMLLSTFYLLTSYELIQAMGEAGEYMNQFKTRREGLYQEIRKVIEDAQNTGN
ncbi:MAG TPA: hypothetical protein VD999_07500 [Vitreimonas sp.]|nr:hypothetical protein [Vitreimonas sp.]